MPTATYSLNASIAGVTVQRSVTRTGDHPNSYEVSLSAALAVGSWVKTDLDTAAGTFTTGHGQTTGTYDVYWTGGARYDVAVTVTGDNLAFEGGTGTDFPSTGNATVVACKQVQINTAIDGDNIQVAAISLEYTDSAATSRGRLLFEDVAAADIASITLTANEPKLYDVAGGDTNPLTGNPITVCRATHSNTSAAATLKIASLEDSTP